MQSQKATLGQPEMRPDNAEIAAPKRTRFIGFVSDQASAEILHEALAPAFPKSNDLHVVNFRAALNLLSGMTTPEIVLVDLTGEDAAYQRHYGSGGGG